MAFIIETANYTLVFKREAAGALDQPGFQVLDINSDKLLFVYGAINKTAADKRQLTVRYPSM